MRCGKNIDAGETCFNCRGSKSRKYKCSFIRSAFVYEGVIKAALREYKYSGKDYLGKFLGKWMWSEFLRHPEFREYEALVAIPLSRSKLRKRGFNQSLLLARVLSRYTGLPVLSGAVTKTRDTPSQALLKREERKTNIVGAFSADREVVAGKKIILIDDVATTGFTLEEAARVLKKAGARKVCAYVLAREN